MVDESRRKVGLLFLPTSPICFSRRKHFLFGHRGGEGTSQTLDSINHLTFHATSVISNNVRDAFNAIDYNCTISVATDSQKETSPVLENKETDHFKNPMNGSDIKALPRHRMDPNQAALLSLPPFLEFCPSLHPVPIHRSQLHHIDKPIPLS